MDSDREEKENDDNLIKQHIIDSPNTEIKHYNKKAQRKFKYKFK